MGRTVGLALAVLALGCGARAVVDAVDGGSASATPSDPSSPGGEGRCPDTPPAPGSPCPGLVYYCHYFTNDDACANSIKCTYKGDAHLWVGGPGTDCTFKAADCAEGLPCGRVFEAEGACIVQADRACQCDAPTGKLRCRSL